MVTSVVDLRSYANCPGHRPLFPLAVILAAIDFDPVGAVAIHRIRYSEIHSDLGS
jgi:hypothetical protein